MERADVVIVGAGVVGAAVAYFLTELGIRDVVLLEAEDVLFRHSTGRNAAYYVPVYESPMISGLTVDSLPFLRDPPAGFSDAALLGTEGAIIAAGPQQLAEHEADLAMARELGLQVETLTPRQIVQLVPIARPEHAAAAAFYREAGPIDVNALAMGYVAGARRRGARLLLGRRVTGVVVANGRVARVRTGAGDLACGALVDAAGAWAGELAAMAGASPIPIQPTRRHMIAVKLPPEHSQARWPFFRAPSVGLYFKPEAGRLLASPMDEDPEPPGDCATDEIQIATVADALDTYTTLQVRHIERAWAGHRSFAPDRLPVLGPDPRLGGFFWAAGLGGAGVMTSPAVGHLVAASIAGGNPAELSPLLPARFA